MKTIKTIQNAAALLATLVLTACATKYNGIKPVSPGAYMPYEKSNWEILNPFNSDLIRLTHDKPIPSVDSLQPTLRWEAVAGVDSYDVTIYTGVPKDPAQVTLTGKEKLEKKRTGWFVKGVEVYYREAIRNSSHRVEEPLQPDTAYVWSVRTRTGTNASPWATYDFQKGGKVAWKYFDGVEGHNWWWPFSTPKQ